VKLVDAYWQRTLQAPDATWPLLRDATHLLTNCLTCLQLDKFLDGDSGQVIDIEAGPEDNNSIPDWAEDDPDGKHLCRYEPTLPGGSEHSAIACTCVDWSWHQITDGPVTQKYVFWPKVVRPHNTQVLHTWY
jgi:hypothetical protein